MAKRYGRNQKRAHRQKIAELKKQLISLGAQKSLAEARARQNADELFKLETRVKQWSDQLRKAYGEFTSLAFDIRVVEVDNLEAPFRFVLEDDEPIAVSSMPDYYVPWDRKIHVLDPLVKAFVDARPEMYQYALTFRLTLTDGNNRSLCFYSNKLGAEELIAREKTQFAEFYAQEVKSEILSRWR